MKTVTEVMRETGLKRNQVMMLIHSKDSKWFRISEKSMWLVDEVDLMKQIQRRKEKAKCR